MICKTCGYEAQKNFYICPSCGGDDIVSQNVNHEANQNKYYQNQNNPNNSSQHQTPFTRPNPSNQNGQSNNNYSDPTLNYQDIPQSFNEPAPIRPVYNPNEMAYYFEGIGKSWSITENEIKISRLLNGGKFTLGAKLSTIILPILAFGAVYFGFRFISETILNNQFLFWLSLVLIPLSFLPPALMKYSTVIVNSSGITVKTLFGKYFIPKEQIDYCDCRSVTRWTIKSYRHGSGYRRRGSVTVSPELYLDVFIIMKDKSKDYEFDTGLCYKMSEPANYLKDEFNRILDVQEKYY